MLKFKRFSHLPFKRLLSTSSNIFEHLKNRTLIRVSGSDVSDFLQGLITNDIGHLGSGPGSMYTMFLNNRGRVLYDAIIYRNSEKDTYLIECDNQGSDVLQKHLKMYRVRRKIDVTNLGDELKIYVLFNHNIQDKMESLDGTINPCQKLNESPPQINNKIHRDLLIYRDPRMSYLGSRIIARADVDVNDQINEIVKVDTASNKNYRWMRYNLGVGEGVDDLPPGECFPLECNCDYLHGVSFHKGCYVGQELTARVYHTGVVRKRLMPIYFNKKPSKVPDEKIIHENVNLGKFKGMEEDVALALLRIDKALAFKEFQLGNGTGYTFKPNWWPVEISKEKVNVSKAHMNLVEKWKIQKK